MIGELGRLLGVNTESAVSAIESSVRGCTYFVILLGRLLDLSRKPRGSRPRPTKPITSHTCARRTMPFTLSIILCKTTFEDKAHHHEQLLPTHNTIHSIHHSLHSLPTTRPLFYLPSEYIKLAINPPKLLFSRHRHANQQD